MEKKIILLSSNSYWNFYNFRKELIDKLVSLNYSVHLLAPRDDNINFFKKKNCICHSINLSRSRVNIINEINLLYNYYKLIKKIRPDFFLPFTIKPNIYGSFICGFFKVKVINNITGLGSSFLNNFILKILVKYLYKISLKNSKAIFFS